MKTGSLLASILLSIVAFGHLLRIAFGVELLVEGLVIPQWPSILGVVIPVGIVWLLWKESKNSERP